MYNFLYLPCITEAVSLINQDMNGLNDHDKTDLQSMMRAELDELREDVNSLSDSVTEINRNVNGLFSRYWFRQINVIG